MTWHDNPVSFRATCVRLPFVSSSCGPFLHRLHVKHLFESSLFTLSAWGPSNFHLYSNRWQHSDVTDHSQVSQLQRARLAQSSETDTPRALNPGVKRPGREADQLPPSRAEVKSSWGYTSTPQYVFMAWCLVKHTAACSSLVNIMLIKFPHKTPEPVLNYFQYFKI
jgi:hypothetical protein